MHGELEDSSMDRNHPPCAHILGRLHKHAVSNSTAHSFSRTHQQRYEPFCVAGSLKRGHCNRDSSNPDSCCRANHTRDGRWLGC